MRSFHKFLAVIWLCCINSKLLEIHIFFIPSLIHTIFANALVQVTMDKKNIFPILYFWHGWAIVIIILFGSSFNSASFLQRRISMILTWIKAASEVYSCNAGFIWWLSCTAFNPVSYWRLTLPLLAAALKSFIF